MTLISTQVADTTKKNEFSPVLPKSIAGDIVDPAFRVKKRDGTYEHVDPLQIVLKVARSCDGLVHVNPQEVADLAVRGIYDGVTTSELDALLIQNCAMMISEEPEYSKLAARLLDVDGEGAVGVRSRDRGLQVRVAVLDAHAGDGPAVDTHKLISFLKRILAQWQGETVNRLDQDLAVV